MMRAFGLLCIAASACTGPLWEPGHMAQRCGPSPSVRRVSVDAPQDPTRPSPAITTLRTRDHEVVVHGGADGLRFTVATADAVVLERQLDAAAFEARFPELHRHFESAFASEFPGEGLSGVWAGL